MTRPFFKEPTYENVLVGEAFGPVTLTLDDFFLRSYAYALDDYSGMKLARDGTLQPVGHVPPHMIVSDLMQIFLTVYDRDKVVGLHQKEEVEHFKPVPVGATLTMTGSYTEKYMKRGKGYTVLECVARDEAGDIVIRQRSTEVMRVPEGIRVGTGLAQPERRVSPRLLRAERADAVSAATPVGTALKSLTKVVRQAQMSVFTGADFHKQGIHTNLEIARATGLRDCIAQGMMESCWASQYLSTLFGPTFLSTGRHFMTYLAPVYPRDTITLEGEVVSQTPESGQMRTEVEFWLVNQDGQTTGVGFGSAITKY
ncbi:MaoC family dehydratase [Mesorhizobium sp. RP14(2022)]|uniref:MaoC family dehydratase n=1 Tax=Mesorhizobium liriopis TaxID=2953882 RepID=A0ABT1CBR2_9HYPH|nr:MaoC family dehydratase [Mesorhizobium liriopis]MCO6052264.1 MaoC family dehydratase [Mesorhizobium liriopis]